MRDIKPFLAQFHKTAFVRPLSGVLGMYLERPNRLSLALRTEMYSLIEHCEGGVGPANADTQLVIVEHGLRSSSDMHYAKSWTTSTYLVGGRDYSGRVVAMGSASFGPTRLGRWGIFVLAEYKPRHFILPYGMADGRYGRLGGVHKGTPRTAKKYFNALIESSNLENYLGQYSRRN